MSVGLGTLSFVWTRAQRPSSSPRAAAHCGPGNLAAADDAGISNRPVLVVAHLAGPATLLVERLRAAGYSALAAHTDAGCLRVATAIGPSLIVMDQAMPRRLDALLRAHPVSARARLLRLPSSCFDTLRLTELESNPRPTL